METQTGNNLIIDVHVSVDCVLIGFDGEQFRVLLVRQIGKQTDALSQFQGFDEISGLRSS